MTEENWDCMNLAYKGLALRIIHFSSHTEMVTLPAGSLNRKDLLGAIVWLCRAPPPSLEEARSDDLYTCSEEYRAAVAAVYPPQVSWFDAQAHLFHLLCPIHP